MTSQSELELIEKAMVMSLFKDAEKVEQALRSIRTETEQMAADLLEGKKVTRALRVKKVVRRRKPHWARSKRLRRDHYIQHLAPKNAEKRARLLKNGDSWELMSEYWHRKKIPVEFTESEWREHVAPSVDGKVFYVNRYDTSIGMRLDNLIIRHTKSKQVLFDGKDYELKLLGYCL